MDERRYNHAQIQATLDQMSPARSSLRWIYYALWWCQDTVVRQRHAPRLSIKRQTRCQV